MASAQTIKEEPGLSEVPNVNIKCEPMDHSGKLGHLQNTNVFCITKIEPVTESSSNLKASTRSSYKLRRKQRVDIFEDPAPEALPAGRKCGFRKPTAPIQIKNLEYRKNHRPSPAENKNKKMKPIKDRSRNVSCEFCAKMFFSLESLENHVADVHVVDKNCPLDPNRSFDDRNLIVQSSDEKLQTQTNCPSLSKIYFRKFPRVRSCDFCSLLFFTVESLEEHVADAHVEDKEFDCTKCDKSFISQERLDLHSPEHEKGQDTQSGIKCPLCYKTFASTRQVDLKRHLTAHQAERPFKCKLCPQSYVQRRDLENHEMNQHGKERRFKCSQCSKSFARNYALKNHIRTHSNTIICETCSASFKTKKGLCTHRICCEGRSSKNKSSINETVGNNTGDVATKRHKTM